MHREEAISPFAVPSAIMLALVVLLLQNAMHTPPSPRPANAPPETFSALRADQVLNRLLGARTSAAHGTGVPHPVASAANHQVLERIKAELHALRIMVEEQEAVGCSRVYRKCAFVRNLLGILPGKTSGVADDSSVLIMVHYDSVPASPGAGDDGAGVAAVLEVARILSSDPGRRNTIIFLFTDAEEVGLLGAEAFFETHPRAGSVGVVLNLEGSGTEGRSMLLRSGPGSGKLVDLYRQTSDYPAGISATNEIFKWMPNDTDFSVAIRRNLPGLDFAFAGERSHYHTMLDNRDNLSLSTLQHHGENLLPLARALANHSLAFSPGDERVYHVLFQRLWLSWSTGATPLIASIALLVIGLGCRAGTRFGLSKGSPRRRTEFYFALLFNMVLLLVIILANLALFRLVDAINGTTVAWPAHGWPFQLMISAGTAMSLLALAWVTCRRLSFWPALQSGWLLWAALAIAPAWILPQAGNTLIIPALLASLLLVAGHMARTRVKHAREITALMIVATVTPFTLGIVMDAESTLGYRLFPLAFPAYALFAMAFAPLVLAHLRDHALWSLISIAGVLMCAGLYAAISLPLHSAVRPQHINILHLQDNDNEVAQWVISSPDPLPKTITSILPLSDDDDPSLPWLTHSLGPSAPAPLLDTPPPFLESLGSRPTHNGRIVKMQYRSARGAHNALVVISPQAELRALTVEGIPQSTAVTSGSRYAGGDHHVISVFGVPPSGFTFELELGGNEPVECYVVDWISQLPGDAALIDKARGTLGVPAHRGDQMLIFIRTTI